MWEGTAVAEHHGNPAACRDVGSGSTRELDAQGQLSLRVQPPTRTCFLLPQSTNAACPQSSSLRSARFPLSVSQLSRGREKGHVESSLDI